MSKVESEQPHSFSRQVNRRSLGGAALAVVLAESPFRFSTPVVTDHAKCSPPSVLRPFNQRYRNRYPGRHCRLAFHLPACLPLSLWNLQRLCIRTLAGVSVRTRSFHDVGVTGHWVLCWWSSALRSRNHVVYPDRPTALSFPRHFEVSVIPE